ncbi:hypothetical protein KP509_37G039500 [Ceratopteris richardii]|uniref:WLM domain-containing protein n=2 Tax=Ceratopteris richardii TaxID=49495 RepID=A0A8T2Q874_CERRI|nr:hypothetical protein KP509_37G039500 [Ceratopteris richardii]
MTMIGECNVEHQWDQNFGKDNDGINLGHSSAGKDVVEETEVLDLSFMYGRNLLRIRMNRNDTLAQLGYRLVSASGVAPHTLRLLLPRVPALLPFSTEHSTLSIIQAGISEERVVRMMGALPEQVEEVSKEAGEAVQRTIIGFSEEDERAKMWKKGRPMKRSLPQGNYIFCDFRTLQLPGIELNPPANRALDIMHKLASDPGIVAIMNKHRWRVQLMTEMAPVGYVGISPKCLLGYNKNQGEEISLRLRTDDLKGFRKYESIKSTLLHELAHMVHSEHDNNFHALNKQLNEEAMALDWTKSGGQSVSGYKSSHYEYEEDELADADGSFTNHAQKLGGSSTHSQLDARSAAALAALARFSSNAERNFIEDTTIEEISVKTQEDTYASISVENLASSEEPDHKHQDSKGEPDCDKLQGMDLDKPRKEHSVELPENTTDLLPASLIQREDVDDKQWTSIVEEPDNPPEVDCAGKEETDAIASSRDIPQIGSSNGNNQVPLTEDPSLKSLQESTERVCQRLQGAIAKLKAEASTSDAAATVQSLHKILGNIMEYPDEEKFKRLRKTNAAFQKRIARFEGAIEVLKAVGFSDGPGMEKDNEYLILKRNDPVLLWLAQSSLESCMA